MFIQGGNVNPSNYLDYAGNYGYYWSSVGRGSSGAYYLRFYSGYVDPSNVNTRYYGQPVRCVALGG